MSKPTREQYKSIEKLELKNISNKDQKTFKKVHCPSCNVEIPAANISLSNSTSKCDSCNVIFSIDNEIELLKTENVSKTEILRPEGIDLFYFKDDMEITIQEQPKGWEMLWVFLLLCIAGFSIAIFIKKGGNFALPITGASILGAIYYAYEWITYSKYKTFIDISDQRLSIKSRPKNIKTDKTFTAEEIDQLYIQASSDGMGHFTINMIINASEGQKHVKLVTVNTLSKAKYLEQEIERYLHVQDRKIPEAHF